MAATVEIEPPPFTLQDLDRGVDLDWEAMRALMPRSPEDFAARREQVLHRRCFPLVPLDTEGVPPPGPDFLRYADDLLGPLELLPVKGVRGAARKEAEARNAEIVRVREAMRRPILEYAYVKALYDRDWEGLPVRVKNRVVQAEFVAGTTWGVRAAGEPSAGYYGPVHWRDPAVPRPRVMLVGKFPGLAEVAAKENFVGPTAAELVKAMRGCGIDPERGVQDWYLTSVVKHPSLDPSRTGLASEWLKNCRPLLEIELRVFRPQFVLCLGTEAAKELIGPKASVGKMFGRVAARVVPLNRPGKPAKVFDFKAMAAVNPGAVARFPEQLPDLVNALGAFSALVAGRRTDDAERDVRHACVYTLRHLRRVVDEIRAEARPGVPQPIAIDCEWHGGYPHEPGAYLRTVQFTHKSKHAWCVVLRGRGGSRPFAGSDDRVAAELRRLFKSEPGKAGRKVRIGGQFLRADLPWLKACLGIDLEDEYRVAKDPEATRTRGGWDTGYMVHAYQESIEGGYKLENLASRFCGVPRYDVALQAWKDKYCKERGLKDKELEGYGQCPDEVLHPYALYDVDATFRLFERFNGTATETGLLDVPMTRADGSDGPTSREGFYRAHVAAAAALEMEETGVLLDRARGDALTATFMAALDERTEEFREEIRWNVPPGDPDWPKGNRFNPGSANQCREFLFGTARNGSLDKATGLPKRLRPKALRDASGRVLRKGALSLGLTPIKAAGQKGMSWERVQREGTESIYNPSTDKETLGILSHDKDEAKGKHVARLRDLRFLSQVLKGVLRPPLALGGAYVRDEDDELTYDGGLMYWMGPDGRVRTHFYPVETGRWSSSRPNLQNISKRRETDYLRILGDPDPAGKHHRPNARYLYPIRSMIAARPGCVLVEADFKMAEMAMIGWLARDRTMMEMVVRNTLSESHPDFIDLHALTAMNAFRLDTPANRRRLAEYNAAKGTSIAWGATKDCLKALGLESLRVAAKNVNFGVPYQRSAEAIARQCHEEGATSVTVADAQRLIDEYYKTYPMIAAFLDACMARVASPGWLCGTFGRLRRFTPADDQAVLAEQQRQACNFPIQNGVADAMNEACRQVFEFRRRHERKGGEETFSMCLQIHDALLFEVPIDYVGWLVDEVLPLCMRDRVDIWPRDLDGVPIAGVDEPHHLDIDVEVARFWGTKIDPEWAESVGLPAKTPKGHKLYKPKVA